MLTILDLGVMREERSALGERPVSECHHSVGEVGSQAIVHSTEEQAGQHSINHAQPCPSHSPLSRLDQARIRLLRGRPRAGLTCPVKLNHTLGRGLVVPAKYSNGLISLWTILVSTRAMIDLPDSAGGRAGLEAHDSLGGDTLG